MKVPNLREFNPTAGQAKHVDDTKMLDTEAREPAENISATNEQKEHIVKGGAFGPLGHKGRH